MTSNFSYAYLTMLESSYSLFPSILVLHFLVPSSGPLFIAAWAYQCRHGWRGKPSSAQQKSFRLGQSMTFIICILIYNASQGKERVGPLRPCHYPVSCRMTDGPMTYLRCKWVSFPLCSCLLLALCVTGCISLLRKCQNAQASHYRPILMSHVPVR